MILQIELLSDLCVSTGETYNSYVDTETVYDDFGLPFIPAKRIKGCIREAALELVEFGCYEKELYDSLFGNEGNRRSLFSIDNAYLENYEEYLSELSNCADKVLVHPQRVLGLYTYIRTQTAMTKDGVAEKGSLRTIRVVNKGHKFFANLQLNAEITKDQRKLLESAVSMVKHIGADRTRGLGMVKLSLEDDKEQNVPKEEVSDTYGDLNKINYTITLKAPLLCKGAEGSQKNSYDYIEGSKIIGLLAQNLSHDSFVELMNHNGQGEGIIASNAYVSEDDKRFTPIRASLQKKKDQVYKDGEMDVKDMLFADPGNEQWTPVGHGYMDEDGHVKNVEVEINYHHRRPDDKSIGRATGENNSAFYQLESIRKGQQFSGFILANEAQAKVVVKALCNARNVRMGYGRNAEYGRVDLCVPELECIKKSEEKPATEFVVKLNSPAILYNDNGVPSADVECLKEYIGEALHVAPEMLSIEKAFLNYEAIGGFNVTWNCRKPRFTALGKGTVCYFRAKEEVDLSLLDNVFIGERVAEGYGELEITQEQSEEITLKKMEKESGESNSEKAENGIISELQKCKKREEIQSKGIEDAKKILEDKMFESKEIDAVLSKLILIVRNEETLDEIREQVKGIETETKRKMSQKLLEPVENYIKEKTNPIAKNEAVKIYLNAYLNRIKYVVYGNKKGGLNKNEQ